jgi:hypothetical protein
MQGAHYEADGGLSSESDGSDDEVEFVDALDIMALPSASPELMRDVHMPLPPTFTFQLSSIGGPSTSATSIQTSQTHLFAQPGPHSGPGSHRISSRANSRG